MNERGLTFGQLGGMLGLAGVNTLRPHEDEGKSTDDQRHLQKFPQDDARRVLQAFAPETD